MRRRALVGHKQLLNFIKRRFIRDGWHTVLYANLTVFEIEYADVLFVFQQRPQAVLRELAAGRCPQSLCIQVCDDFRNRLARSVSVENVFYDRCSSWVNFKTLIFGQLISKRYAPSGVFTFLRVLAVATADVL